VAYLDLEFSVGSGLTSLRVAPARLAHLEQQVVSLSPASVWPPIPLAAAAQRMCRLVPLALAIAPHVLRMTPEEFGMILAGVRASAVSACRVARFLLGSRSGSIVARTFSNEGVTF